MTLPTLAAGLRYGFYQEADFKMVITSAPADSLVVFNDLAADTVTADQSGKKIGWFFEVVPNADASKWIVLGHQPQDLASNTSAVTIAT